MKLAKEFRWEMGHRLPLHKGACRNIHGHSYRMEVEVEGDVDPETGMVMDFGDISAVVKPFVAEMDHCFLCQDSDTELLKLFQSMGMKMIVIPYPSTVENICRMVVERLEPAFQQEGQGQVHAFTVRIWETVSSVAELRKTL